MRRFKTNQNLFQSFLFGDCFGLQAYEGLQTAHKLKQEYVFLPAKLKEVYLYYLLEHLEDHKVHTTSKPTACFAA